MNSSKTVYYVACNHGLCRYSEGLAPNKIFILLHEPQCFDDLQRFAHTFYNFAEAAHAIDRSIKQLAVLKGSVIFDWDKVQEPCKLTDLRVVAFSMNDRAIAQLKRNNTTLLWDAKLPYSFSIPKP